MDESKWRVIENQNTNSKFCKALAVAIWRTEELADRSVTGAVSNKAKDKQPKKALTPKKVAVIKGKLFSSIRGTVIHC